MTAEKHADEGLGEGGGEKMTTRDVLRMLARRAQSQGYDVQLAPDVVLDLITEIEALRAGLEGIANDPHCSYGSRIDPNVSYATGVVDGHRCAAQKARACLAAVDGGAKL